MSAIDYINTITSSLIGIVGVGGAFVGGYNAIKMIMADDEYEALRCKKSIKKAIIGVILGVSISGLTRYIFSVI